MLRDRSLPSSSALTRRVAELVSASGVGSRMRSESGDREEGLWDATDVAKYLRVSRSFVYKAIESGVMPVIRLGAAVRFDPDVIRAWAHGQATAGRAVKLPGCRGR